jgi:hypothetical protein
MMKPQPGHRSLALATGRTVPPDRPLGSAG